VLIVVKMSGPQQRNAVSEGMALGLVMCGRFALSWDKIGIDLSFEGAWRSWSYRDRFSQVSTDLRNGLDAVWAMTEVGVRKHTLNFYWDTGGPEVSIYPRPIWSDGDVDVDEAARLIAGGVPADGWEDLATDFLKRFEGDG
jgi:hypothetical protein